MSKKPGNSVGSCVDRFLSRYSTLQEAADVVQVVSGRIADRQMMYKWRKTGYITWTFALAVEEITEGEITVQEILREALERLHN